MSRPIPVLTTFPGIESWRQSLKQSSKTPLTPKIPWNFAVVNKQGGNYLTWQSVNGADGYIVEISTNGDFSTGVDQKLLVGNDNVSYFDTVPTSGGAAPPIRYYRVRATAGTQNQPHSVTGIASGVISSTAMAPNDVVTAPTSQIDTTITDNTQSRTGGGDYRNILPRE